MANLGLNLSGVQAQTSFDPLPPGDYVVQITDTEVKQSKSGNTMLVTTLTVVDGVNHGRKIFEQFVIGNEVAMKRLKSLAIAGNHPHPDSLQDSEELHGLKLGVRLKVEDNGEYGLKNRISGFKKLGEDAAGTLPTLPPARAQAPVAPPPAATAPTPTLPPPPPPAAPPAQTAATGKLPWE